MTNTTTALITATAKVSSRYFEDDTTDNIWDAQGSLIALIGSTKEEVEASDDPILQGVWRMANDISDLISDLTGD